MLSCINRVPPTINHSATNFCRDKLSLHICESNPHYSSSPLRLHSGYKMSFNASLISIKDALDYHSPIQIRLAFLLHPWKDTLDYDFILLNNAVHYQRVVREFKCCVEHLLRHVTGQEPSMNPNDNRLQKVFLEKKVGVHEALCDIIDTQRALHNIQELIQHSNRYILKNKKGNIDKHLLEDILSYVLKTLKMFGADFGELGSGNNVIAIEKIHMPISTAFAEFRENILMIVRQEI